MKRFALLAVAAPLVLAACGGGSPAAQVKVDPVAYVKHSAAKTAQASSEHMAMTMTMSVAGHDVSMKGSGDYLNSPPKGTFAFSTSLMGQNVTFNAVEDGTTMYMQSPLITSQLPNGATSGARGAMQDGTEHRRRGHWNGRDGRRTRASGPV